MDPLTVIDAKKVVPDPFALTVAAAARARALRHGAEPRIDAEAEPGAQLALSEIAAGAFAEEELAPFLSNAPAKERRLAPPAARPRLCHGGQAAAAAPVLPPMTVH